jgi:hypothetical protein
MENNKYFVPDIEDFRFGYEFEKNYSSSGGDWYPTKIVAYLDFEGLDFYIKEGLLRTPYLTKEQIEAEGWFDVDKDKSYRTSGFIIKFSKGNYMLGFNEETCFVSIMPIDPVKWEWINTTTFWYAYQGECKSINEFRFICKLLKI